MGQVAPVRPGAVLCRAHAGASVRAGPGPREHRTPAVGSGTSAALVVLGKRRDGASCHEQRAGVWPSRHQGGASDQESAAGGRRPGRRATLAATAATSRPGVAVSGPEPNRDSRRPAAVSPRRWSAGRRRVQARRAQDPRVPAVACGRSAGSRLRDSTRMLILVSGCLRLVLPRRVWRERCTVPATVLTVPDLVLCSAGGASPSKPWPLPSGEGNHGQRRRRTAARAATPAAGAGGDPSPLRRDGRPHGLPVRADEAEEPERSPRPLLPPAPPVASSPSASWHVPAGGGGRPRGTRCCSSSAACSAGS